MSTVRRANFRKVRVRAGHEHLTLRFYQADVVVAPSSNSDDAWVRMLGPLPVEGWVRVDRYGFAQPIDVVPNMIKAGSRATLTEVRATANQVIGTLEMGGLQIPHITLPCSALGGPLGLDWGADTVVRAKGKATTIDGPLHMRPQPGWGREVLVHNIGVTYYQLGQAPGWLKLSMAYDDGTTVSGWASRSEIDASTWGEGGGSGRGEGLALCGAEPTCVGAGHLGRLPVARAAMVDAGTPVSTQPDGPVWVTFAKAADVIVLDRTPGPWVELIHVPGVAEDRESCEVLRHAWIPRSAVHFKGPPAAGS